MDDAQQAFCEALRDALEMYQPEWHIRRHVDSWDYHSLEQNRQLGVWVDTLRRWVDGENFPRVKKFEGFLDTTEFPDDVRESLYRMFHHARSAPRRHHGKAISIGTPMISSVKPFIGRKPQVNQLLQWLDDDGAMLTIIGRSGIGKTALACHVLQQQSASTVVYLPAQQPTLEGIFLALSALDESLQQLWTSPNSLNHKLDRLFDTLHSHDIIILLDDVMLDKDGRIIEPELLEFMKALVATDIRLIMTSQLDPALPAALRPANVIVPLTEGLALDDGVELLKKLGATGDLSAMVQHVHGIPRALEVIAGLPNDAVEHSTALDELHQLSYERLTDTEYQVLEALAVLRQPVKPAVITALLDIDHVLPAVQHLIRARLVEGNRITGEVHLKPIEAGLVYGQLNERQRLKLERAAADYFVDVDPLRAFDHLVHSGQMKQALDVLIEHRQDFINAGYLHRVLAMHRQLKLSDPRNECYLADTLRLIGDYEKAASHYENAIDMARMQDNDEWLAKGLLGLGDLNRILGRYEPAIEAYELAMEASGEVDEPAYKGLGMAYFHLGESELGLQCLGETSNANLLRAEILYHSGDFVAALDLLQDKLDRLAPLEQFPRYSLMSVIHADIGELDLAVREQQYAITLADQVDAIHTQCLLRLGTLKILLGDTGSGEDALQSALSEADRLGNREVETSALNILARQRMRDGRINMAGYILSLLLQAGWSTRSRVEWEAWHTTAAGFCLLTEQLEGARTMIHKAIAYPVIHQHHLTLAVQAIVKLLSGDQDGARVAFNHALDAAQSPKLKDTYHAYYTQGLAYAGLSMIEGNYWLDDARRAYREARWRCDAPGIVDEAHFWLELLGASHL
ncbi:MAG: tetratricopeptide repeat protein [Chloroflexi bacterium]|nr:tetratricopeptide repeat protein [Chloroflexota bacterium]